MNDSLNNMHTWHNNKETTINRLAERKPATRRVWTVTSRGDRTDSENPCRQMATCHRFHWDKIPATGGKQLHTINTQFSRRCHSKLVSDCTSGPPLQHKTCSFKMSWFHDWPDTRVKINSSVDKRGYQPRSQSGSFMLTRITKHQQESGKWGQLYDKPSTD